MNVTLVALLLVVVLFATMLGFQEVGRRLGLRHRRSEHGGVASGAAEGAVFGMLGLFLAFAFSGAGARFDERRHLIVDEANAIGTAWLRIDVLPDSSRPAMRALFRSYVDARLETYRLIPDMDAVWAAHKRATELQGRIWTSALAAADAHKAMPPYTVFLPALNEMFDIASTRVAATRMHPPFVVFVIIGALALFGSLFAGYGLASRPKPSWLHTLGFATVITIAVYVTVDLEFPRMGLIQVDSMDEVIADVRRSMDESGSAGD